MDSENLLENGIIILLISIVWLLAIKNLLYNTEKQPNKDGNESWSNKYFKFYDRIYSYPLFIVLFASGLSLIYNGLAFKYGWPVFLKFLFEIK